MLHRAPETGLVSIPIKITVDGHELTGNLNDSETAQALGERLPLRISMSRWGDEFYGSVGTGLDVSMAPDARAEMEIGEIAYWLPGSALCIFFGPTPASLGDEPRAASEVNPIGTLTGDVSVLKKLGQSVKLTVESAES